MTKRLDTYELTYYPLVEDEQIIMLDKLQPLTITVKNRNQLADKLLQYLDERYYYNERLDLYTCKNYFKDDSFVHGKVMSLGFSQYCYEYYHCKKNNKTMGHDETIIDDATITSIIPILVQLFRFWCIMKVT